jgi:hypothetical protein
MDTRSVRLDRAASPVAAGFPAETQADEATIPMTAATSPPILENTFT